MALTNIQLFLIRIFLSTFYLMFLQSFLSIMWLFTHLARQEMGVHNSVSSFTTAVAALQQL
jgi:hypothetical protein